MVYLLKVFRTISRELLLFSCIVSGLNVSLMEYYEAFQDFVYVVRTKLVHINFPNLMILVTFEEG